MKLLTEAQLQSQIVSLGRLYGWRIHAERPAMMRSGKWSTPIQGDVGWVDLVLLKDKRLIFWELKSTTGRLSEEQKQWLDMLSNVPNVLAECVYPSDWEHIQRVLTE